MPTKRPYINSGLKDFQENFFDTVIIKDEQISCFKILSIKTISEKVCKTTLLRESGELGSLHSYRLRKGLLSLYKIKEIPADIKKDGSIFSRYTHFGLCKLDNSETVWKFKVVETEYYEVITILSEQKIFNLTSEKDRLFFRNTRRNLVSLGEIPTNVFHKYSFSRGFFETDFAKDVFLEKVRNFKVA